MGSAAAAAVPPSGAAPDTLPAWCGHGSGRWRGAGALESLGWPVLSGPTCTRPQLPLGDPMHKPTSTTKKQRKIGVGKARKVLFICQILTKFNYNCLRNTPVEYKRSDPRWEGPPQVPDQCCLHASCWIRQQIQFLIVSNQYKVS